MSDQNLISLTGVTTHMQTIEPDHSASAAHLVICCQLGCLFGKVFVKQVQGHLITRALTVRQEIIKAHGIVSC